MSKALIIELRNAKNEMAQATLELNNILQLMDELKNEMMQKLQDIDDNKAKSDIFEADIKKIKSVQNGLETRLKTLEGKFQEFETNGQSEIKSELVQLKNKLEKLPSLDRILALEGNNNNLDSKLQAINNQISQQSQKMQSIQSSLNQVTSNISSFATRQISTKKN